MKVCFNISSRNSIYKKLYESFGLVKVKRNYSCQHLNTYVKIHYLLNAILQITGIGQ